MKLREFFTPFFLALSASTEGFAGVGICLDRNAETREISATIYQTGCISSSNIPLPHTIITGLDASTATINVNGNFHSKSGLLQLMDCGGGQALEVAFPDTEARRYKLVWNGVLHGVANFLDNTGEICSLRTKMETPEFQSEWDRLDSDEFPRTTELSDLVEQVTGSLPASPFGLPSMTIKMVPNISQGHWGMQIDITQYGPLDDNLDGIQTVLVANREWNGWVVETAYRRYICSSGSKAGQWNVAPC